MVVFSRPGHHARSGIPDLLQFFDQHVRESRQKAVAGVQSQSNEVISQLFCDSLWEHVSDGADSAQLKVG